MNGRGYKESDFAWHWPHLASPCSGVNGCFIPWHAGRERQKVQRAHSSFKHFFPHKLLKINRKGRAALLSHNDMLSFQGGDTRNSPHFVYFLPGSPGIRELTSHTLNLRLPATVWQRAVAGHGRTEPPSGPAPASLVQAREACRDLRPPGPAEDSTARPVEGRVLEPAAHPS